MENKEKLNNILASFKIKAQCVSHSKIRNVSLYDLNLSPGTRVGDIRKFSDEISLALKAKAKPIVKILSELGIVRLEIIDDIPETLSFFQELSRLNMPKGEVPMYFGSSVSGEDMWVDIAKNPHMIIAGTTGSGKSTFLHVVMANALRLLNVDICIMDTKNVEFGRYKEFNNVRVANDYNSSVNMLKSIHREMEYRYKFMSDNREQYECLRVTNTGYPSIILIIDEFADLILQDESKIFYTLLCKLAQKSRAAGIYCVLATQRPSTDVLRGAIKANFPARVSCQVASHVDSKVVLDFVGAELLAGRGDAIIRNYNNNNQRFQIPYTTPEEVCKFYAR